MIKLNIFSTIGITSLLCCISCSSNKATIEGQIAGRSNDTIYLERVLPGDQQFTDTTVLGNEGNFTFKVELPQGATTIYNLHYMGNKVPLILSPKERVTISAVGSLQKWYTIEGSAESARAKELNDLLKRGIYGMDSLVKAAGEMTTNEAKTDFSRKYSDIYYKTKRGQISFIASEPTSMASLYALYQRLPNDQYLNSEQTDIIYYQIIADSITKTYPDSPYLKALKREIQDAEDQKIRMELLNEKLENATELGFPEISLNDLYNKEHKLSESLGRVTLVCFWSVAIESAVMNAELKKIYEELEPMGLQIYQIGTDREKSVWVDAILAQKMKWINVYDKNLLAARTYNVDTLPYFFIIDSQGELVDRGEYNERLIRKIVTLIQQ